MYELVEQGEEGKAGLCSGHRRRDEGFELNPGCGTKRQHGTGRCTSDGPHLAPKGSVSHCHETIFIRSVAQLEDSTWNP